MLLKNRFGGRLDRLFILDRNFGSFGDGFQSLFDNHGFKRVQNLGRNRSGDMIGSNDPRADTDHKGQQKDQKVEYPPFYFFMEDDASEQNNCRNHGHKIKAGINQEPQDSSGCRSEVGLFSSLSEPFENKVCKRCE